MSRADYTIHLSELTEDYLEALERYKTVFVMLERDGRIDTYSVQRIMDGYIIRCQWYETANEWINKDLNIGERRHTAAMAIEAVYEWVGK